MTLAAPHPRAADKSADVSEADTPGVRTVTKQAAFSLRQYQWNSRVLVVSASSNDDDNLSAQQDELALTPDEFMDRDMVLVTLLDNAVSTAGSRELTNAEVAAARKALGIRPGSFALKLIGKDGSVKLSSDKATSMVEIYALIDTMPMRQRERSNR